MGGGMRQSGILAAAALYALENNVEKLTQDHQHARELASTLRELGFTVRSNTNMVYFDAKNPEQLIEKLQMEGIWALPLGAETIRMVTHLQVTPKGIQRTCEALKQHSTAHLLS
jgi:threonine aldolase